MLATVRRGRAPGRGQFGSMPARLRGRSLSPTACVATSMTLDRFRSSARSGAFIACVDSPIGNLMLLSWRKLPATDGEVHVLRDISGVGTHFDFPNISLRAAREFAIAMRCRACVLGSLYPPDSQAGTGGSSD